MTGRQYRYGYTVKPLPNRLARFPVDMLRYDRAFPASETDARVIEQTWTEPPIVPVVGLVGLKPPQRARWASFGWEVSEEVVRTVVQT